MAAPLFSCSKPQSSASHCRIGPLQVLTPAVLHPPSICWLHCLLSAPGRSGCTAAPLQTQLLLSLTMLEPLPTGSADMPELPLPVCSVSTALQGNPLAAAAAEAHRQCCSACRLLSVHTALSTHVPCLQGGPPAAAAEADADEAAAPAQSAERELDRLFNKADFASMVVVGQFNLGFILATLGQVGHHAH